MHPSAEPSETPSPTPTPALPAPPSYHWTPANQREFLEGLAYSGSVKGAAAMIGMSTRAAYDLRHRADGAAFRLGWAAAILIARARLSDELLDRAINGAEESYERGPADRAGWTYVKRRRHVPSLGLAMLARLDQMADKPAPAGEAALAQIIAGDWAAFLDLIGRDDGAAQGDGCRSVAIACWLAGRDSRANPLARLWKDSAIASEVAQISADFADEDADAATTPLAPEATAAEMSVWYDDEAEGWRTNFPPAADFEGEEDGLFGDPDYARALSIDEEIAQEEAIEAETAPLRAAGEAARRVWFGLPANDDEQVPAADLQILPTVGEVAAPHDDACGVAPDKLRADGGGGRP